MAMIMPALLPAFQSRVGAAAGKGLSSIQEVALGSLILTSSTSHQFINAHNNPTTQLFMFPDVKIRNWICESFSRDKKAFVVESDSDLLKVLCGLLFGRITPRSTGRLLH